MKTNPPRNPPRRCKRAATKTVMRQLEAALDKGEEINYHRFSFRSRKAQDQRKKCRDCFATEKKTETGREERKRNMVGKKM